MRSLNWYLILVLMIMIFPVVAQETYIYEEEGIISENGDSTLDGGEYSFIHFQIDRGEKFEIELTVDEGDLGLIFLESDDENDLLDAINSLSNGNDPEAYFWAITIENKIEIDYTFSDETEGNVAIFSGFRDNPSNMFYTFKSSIEPSSSNDVFILAIIAAVIVFSVIIGYNKMTENNQKTDSSKSSGSIMGYISCSACGQYNMENDSYCRRCGRRL